MKRKSFTIMEVLITVIVLAILSSAGIVTWSSMIEKTRVTICEQNQWMLKEALKLYISDQEAVPASLSQLIPKYTDFAIARLKEERPYTYLTRKICVAALDISEAGTAWAQPSFRNYVGLHTAILNCPSKIGAGLSYGFNTRLTNPGMGRTVREEFELLEANGLPIICDSDNATFTVSAGGDIYGASYRHGKSAILHIFGKEPTAVVVGGKRRSCIITDDKKNWDEPYGQLKKGGTD